MCPKLDDIWITVLFIIGKAIKSNYREIDKTIAYR